MAPTVRRCGTRDVAGYKTLWRRVIGVIVKLAGCMILTIQNHEAYHGCHLAVQRSCDQV